VLGSNQQWPSRSVRTANSDNRSGRKQFQRVKGRQYVLPTSGLFIQPEGLLRRRSISSALVIAVEKQVPGWTAIKTFLTANLSWTL